MLTRSLAGILSGVLSLTLASFGNAYDFDDPNGSHTNEAIRFDGEGDRMNSLRSFQSAVRFTPSAETYANLGVCLMRLGTATPTYAVDEKEEWYHKAHAAINTAKTLAITDKEWTHVDENAKALKQSMNAENVETPSGKPLNPLEHPNDSPGRKPKSRLPGGTFSTMPKSMSGGKRRGGASDSAPRQPPRPPVAQGPHRERLLHQRNVPFGHPFPKVTVADLNGNDPRFELYRQRREPFILVDGMSGWKSLEEWPDKWQSYLAETFPDAVTDFYPHNMLSEDRQSPYLTRLPQAVKEVMIESGPGQQSRGSKFAYDANSIQGRYMHLQLTPKMWTELEERGDISPDRHWHFSSDEWLEDCLGFPDSQVSEEYHLKTHWKIILTGARGAGMFNHSDSLMTSSWHSHIMGSKWWYVCGTLTNGTKGVCFEDYVLPGQTLYYGTGWYHETQNLETPTMTLTDTVAHEHNFGFIADQLHATCTHDKMRFRFSAEMCDELDGCFERLYEMHKGKPKPAHMWPAWRSVATPDHIKERESVLSTHNNYDGRNYITEA